MKASHQRRRAINEGYHEPDRTEGVGVGVGGVCLCTTALAKDAPLTSVPPQAKLSKQKPETNHPLSHRAPPQICPKS